MRISDWSSDVCSSDLPPLRPGDARPSRFRRLDARQSLSADERRRGGRDRPRRARCRDRLFRCPAALSLRPPRTTPRRRARPRAPHADRMSPPLTSSPFSASRIPSSSSFSFFFPLSSSFFFFSFSSFFLFFFFFLFSFF